jgi:PhnB protein
MPKNPPAGYNAITPYAVVADPDALIDFVTKVLGGELKDRMMDGDRVMHAELTVGDSMLMTGSANDQNPPFPAMLHVYVDDVDAVYRAALDHGAISAQEPTDQFYGDRMASVADSQGNSWWLATRVEDVSPDEMERRLAAQRA